MAYDDDRMKLRDSVPGDEPVGKDTDWEPGDEGDFLHTFTNRMSAGWSAMQENWEQAREDVEFTYEKQWDEWILRQRKGRPSLTLNLLPQYVNHLVGQARRSKVSVIVKHKGGVSGSIPLWSDPTTRMTRAEVMSGIVRDIEQRSKAPMAYSKAMQHAVEGGFGWLRVRTFRPKDDPRHIEIKVEHVPDRWSVLFDPIALYGHVEDARWAAISVRQSAAEFRARYPHASDGGGLPTEYDDGFHEWWGEEGETRVTDYYFFQAKKRQVMTWINPDTREEVWGYEDYLRPVLDEIEEEGMELISSEPMMVDCLYWSRVTANEILEKPTLFPGTMIPIVPVFGRQADLHGRKSLISLTRYAKDAQRMYNSWASAATETVAKSPSQPWLITEEQMAGHEKAWDNARISTQNVLPYNWVDGQPPPQRQPPANSPQAELTMMGVGHQAVMETTGMHESLRGLRSNETSGTAITRRQVAGEISIFEFADNLTHSVGMVGEILCQLIPEVYHGDRIQTIVLPDDSSALVHLGHEIRDRDTGQRFNLGSLRLARYHCLSQAGGTIASEREQMMTVALEMAKTNPQGFNLALDVIFEMMDTPGARQLAERFKKMLPRHLLSPEDQQRLPPPEPTPEQQIAVAESEAKGMKAQSDRAQAEIDLQVAQVKLAIERVKLEREKLSGVEKGGEQDKDAMKSMVREMIVAELAGRAA